MTIDYLDLPGWKTLGKRTEGGEDWPVVDGPILRKSLMASQEGKCSSCGATYDREFLHLVRVGAGCPFDDPLHNTELMCGECRVRFHTDGTHLKGHLTNPDSTLGCE